MKKFLASALAGVAILIASVSPAMANGVDGERIEPPDWPITVDEARELIINEAQYECSTPQWQPTGSDFGADHCVAVNGSCVVDSDRPYLADCQEVLYIVKVLENGVVKRAEVFRQVTVAKTKDAVSGTDQVDVISRGQWMRAEVNDVPGSGGGGGC